MYKELDEINEVTGITHAICIANIKFLAASEGGCRYICTLVLEAVPPEIEWWDALGKLDRFDVVAVKIPCPDWMYEKAYGVSGDVTGGSKRWEEISDDFRRALDSYFDYRFG